MDQTRSKLPGKWDVYQVPVPVLPVTEDKKRIGVLCQELSDQPSFYREREWIPGINVGGTEPGMNDVEGTSGRLAPGNACWLASLAAVGPFRGHWAGKHLVSAMVT